MRNQGSWRRLAAAGSTVALVVILVSIAQATSSSSFTYTTAKTGYLSISSSDFTPDGTASANNYYNHWDTGVRPDAGETCLDSGFHLPQGAKLQKAQVFFASNNSKEIFVKVMRNTMATQTNDEYAAKGNFPDSGGNASSATISIPSNKQTIDNKKYAYHIGLCVDLGATVSAVRLQYKYKSAGD